MSPPAEPLQDPAQVTFVDFPAAIELSTSFTPLTTSYPTFLSLLRTLSGSVVHKLDSLPQQYVQGQGFTLSEGGWWYRLVKPVSSGISETSLDQTTLERSPWTLLDCLYGYDKLVAELCLGVKWSGARVEVQHNLQKKRDEARVNHALRSGHDSRITSQELHGREDVGPDEDGMDEGPGPSIDESNNAGKRYASFAGPLIVSSPAVGIVSLDEDDEGDDSTPTHNFSTPVTKATPELAHPNTASSKSELVEGPASIAYLPVYQAQPDHSRLPSEISFNSRSVNRLTPDPELRFYPPPPGATGSPNDMYRQVLRSGGAVRNPNHQPYKYRYGGPEQLLAGPSLPSAYNQQQHFPIQQQHFAIQQQNTGQSHYNSPTGTFNPDGSFFNQVQHSEIRQQQPFEQQSSPAGSYRGCSPEKYDVRKTRGRYEKSTEHNRHGSRKQHQNSSRPTTTGKGQSFPLDPALEVNYRSYIRQKIQNIGQGHYPIHKHTGSYNQNPYATIPQFGYNSGCGDRYGNYNENDNGYQRALPAPPAFNNISNSYAPSAFTTLERGIIPSFSPKIGMMPPQVTVPPTQGQQRQPFVPSPFAATFTPRFSNIQNEVEGRGQHQDHTAANEAEPFQQQLNPGMLPLAPFPFGGRMPLPMPPAAELVSRAPHFSTYERPKPIVSMPPVGDFSPPKARKSGRKAKKVLEKLMASSGPGIPSLIASTATAAAAFNLVEGNENASVGPGTSVDELDGDYDNDDGDSEYIPKNEGRKKHKKPKKPRDRKSRRGSSFSMKDEAKAVEGHGVDQDGTHGAARARAESEARVKVEEDEKMAER